MKICYYIYILSMILVEKAQYNSCCFLLQKEENYNAVVSRQNIRIRLPLFLLFDVNFFFVLFLRDKF